MTKQEETEGTYCSKNGECVYWGKPECPFRNTGKAYSECTAFRTTLPTKQEDLREWAEGFLRGTAHNGYYDGLEITMLEELSDLGVVIKVEGELPNFIEEARDWEAVKRIEGKLAGYVAVEPLVEIAPDFPNIRA